MGIELPAGEKMFVDTTQIKRKLKALKDTGISYRAMAEKMDSSNTYLSNVLKDKVNFGYVLKFIKLIKFLEMDIDEVVGEEL